MFAAACLFGSKSVARVIVCTLYTCIVPIIKVPMTRNFLLSCSKELSEWRRMALTLLWSIAQPRSQGLSSSLPRKGRREILGTRLGSTLSCRVIEYFDFVFYFGTSQQEHKVVWNHKKLNISHDFFCIELKLSTVATFITKFHDMSTVTFPWQHNGLQALSSQRGKSEFSSFKKCYLLLLFIQ